MQTLNNRKKTIKKDTKEVDGWGCLHALLRVCANVNAPLNLKNKTSVTCPTPKTKKDDAGWTRKGRNGRTLSQQLEEPKHNVKLDILEFLNI